MKCVTYFSLCILLFVLGSPSSVLAQEHAPQMRFSLYGGAAVPQGEFGSISGDKGGFANTGFCAMIEGSRVLAENINWISSVSLAINGTDEASLENDVQDIYPDITVTSGNYTTIWAMTGIGFETIASPEIRIYGLGQMGLLFSSFPDITFSSGGESISQTTTSEVAFAYGLGTGIIINKLNISIRYYASEPEYKQSVSYMGETTSAKTKMPAAILQLMFGFSL